MGKSVTDGKSSYQRFVRLRIFTPFCFGSCMIPQQFNTNNWGLFGKENYLTFDGGNIF